MTRKLKLFSSFPVQSCASTLPTPLEENLMSHLFSADSSLQSFTQLQNYPTSVVNFSHRGREARCRDVLPYPDSLSAKDESTTPSLIPLHNQRYHLCSSSILSLSNCVRFSACPPLLHGPALPTEGAKLSNTHWMDS